MALGGDPCDEGPWARACGEVFGGVEEAVRGVRVGGMGGGVSGLRRAMRRRRLMRR